MTPSSTSCCPSTDRLPPGPVCADAAVYGIALSVRTTQARRANRRAPSFAAFT